MGSGAGLPSGTLRVRWLLLLGLVGPVLGAARPGFQQTSHLSSYEIITPWRLTRERREAPRPYSKQVSYVIQAEGKEHIIHLERNKDLLPEDFVVYTYNKEGTLITDHPNIQRCGPLCIREQSTPGDRAGQNTQNNWQMSNLAFCVYY
ncbi:ADAM9 isoform 9 [Pongo abelii]|uniref:ADAM metallopeptidase domain 9 n=1 Tax=Pongo abelii TaxID=9601 RepID=A0A2J8TNY7_PONAB|nr:ADAM9 isoform 9 [Pongo abelii]